MIRTRLTRRQAVAALGAAAMLPSGVRAQQGLEILTYTGGDRQQRLLDGARKEGQVVLYSAMIANQGLQPIVAGFMRKYPFVKATFWRAAGENIAQKITAEIRANNVVADVIEGTSLGEMSEASINVPYRTPAIEAYPQQYRDPEGLWTPTRISYFSIAYNTRQIPDEKAPRTYEDLLDPQWQGKMAWRIGSASGTPLFITNLRVALGEERARAYFERLRAQKVVNFGSGSARTLVDRVIAGEFAIALNIFAHHPLISRAKGAPVNSRLMAPVPSTAAMMSLPKGLRHPHAALLLVDYILSEEGQAILQSAEYFPAHPGVAPSPALASVIPRVAGVPENFIDPAKYAKFTPASEKIYEELFRT